MSSIKFLSVENQYSIAIRALLRVACSNDITTSFGAILMTRGKRALCIIRTAGNSLYLICSLASSVIRLPSSSHQLPHYFVNYIQDFIAGLAFIPWEECKLVLYGRENRHFMAVLSFFPRGKSRLASWENAHA